MNVLAEKQFKDLDVLIKSLENFKYTYEGPHRTEGSYMLTWVKSGRTTSHKDLKMWEEICKFNKNMGDQRYNEGFRNGVILSGIAVASFHIGSCVTNYIYDKIENKENNKNKGDVIEHE